MANTTTKAKTTATKEVNSGETKAKETKLDASTQALKDAMDMIAQLRDEIEELKKDKPQELVVKSSQGKKVKCISICHHPVNVFTQPDCKGKVFAFKEYGQIIQMRVDELLDVLAYYPKTMASGLIYICDKEIVEDNGLAEAYKHIYKKEEMDMIGLLRRECDAEFILNMSDDLRESTIIAVIQNYKNGEKMDASALNILRGAGYDIAKLAEESK